MITTASAPVGLKTHPWRWALLGTGCGFFLLGDPATLDLRAQDLAELAGHWNHVSMSTPSSLVLQRDPQGRLRSIEGGDLFETAQMALNVDTEGRFTGPYSGHLEVAGPGLIRVHIPTQPDLLLSVNQRGDVMAGAKVSSDGRQHDLELVLKAPGTLAISELAGTWRGVNLITPSLIEPILDQGLVVGLGMEGRFLARLGSVSVASDGSISGTMGGPFSGHLIVGTAGRITMHIDEPPPDPGFDLSMVINAGKDVLVAQTRDAQGEQELVVFVRVPTALALAELTGLWRGSSLGVPHTLTLRVNDTGAVVDLEGARDFEPLNDLYSVGHTGGVLGWNEPMAGQIALGATGQLTVTGTQEEGQPFTQDFWSNASQDFMVAISTFEGQELTVALRAPPGPETDALASKLRWGRHADCLMLRWSSGAHRQLQHSTNLLDWLPVAGTLGQATWQSCPGTNPEGYYRVQTLDP